MIPITAINVNEAFPRGIQLLHELGIQQPSQHGDTLEMDQPVSVMYLNPRERILFDKDRASNPFLNLFEALWIIAGRNDVAFLQRLVGRMATYSDDGVTYYGAYGWRLKNRLGNGTEPATSCDQIKKAIERLTKNPNDRQVVLTIRDPGDMFYVGKDQPCNLMMALKVRQGKLNVHVFNRSNDFIWGMTGTNVVQFSMLQEYLAGRIGVEVGTYHQTTDSMHVYVNEQWEKLKNKRCGHYLDPYENGDVKPYDMMQKAGVWDDDLKHFFNLVDRNMPVGNTTTVFATPFFREVVAPLWRAFEEYELYRETKAKEQLSDAISFANTAADCDWKYAAVMWLENIQRK